MKAIKTAVGAAGFAVIAAGVTVGLTRSLAADNAVKSEAVADANGSLHVPDAYRTTYEFLEPGRQPPTRARVRKSSTPSMHRPAPSPPIARADIFPMAPCS